MTVKGAQTTLQLRLDRAASVENAQLTPNSEGASIETPDGVTWSV